MRFIRDLLTRPDLWIALITALLPLIGKYVKHLSFLARKAVAMALFSVALVSIGFFAGYLHYNRNWIFTGTTGPTYDFSQRQDATPKPTGKTWCQWALDPQNTVQLKKRGLLVFQDFPINNDILFEGKGRPRIGYLALGDRPNSEEPVGRLGVVIFNYEMPRFAMSSDAELHLKTTMDPRLGMPPVISVTINDHFAGSTKVTGSPAEHTIIFHSSYLASATHNYIYLTPDFDGSPGDKSKLLYIESLRIETH